MTNQEYRAQQDRIQSEMQEELLRVMEIMDDNGFPYCGHTDFGYCKQYVAVKTLVDGMYHTWCWAIPNRDDMEDVLRWFIADTKFYDVTVIVEGGPNVTFGRLQSLDREYKHYYAE
jgi:hypothetical protein